MLKSVVVQSPTCESHEATLGLLVPPPSGFDV